VAERPVVPAPGVAAMAQAPVKLPLEQAPRWTAQAQAVSALEKMMVAQAPGELSLGEVVVAQAPAKAVREF